MTAVADIKEMFKCTVLVLSLVESIWPLTSKLSKFQVTQ